MISKSTQVYPLNFEDVEIFGYSNSEVLEWLNKITLKDVASVEAKEAELSVTVGGRALELTLDNFCKLISGSEALDFLTTSNCPPAEISLKGFPKFLVKYLADKFCSEARRSELVDVVVDFPNSFFLKMGNQGKKTLSFTRRHLPYILSVDKETRSITLVGTRVQLCFMAEKIVDKNGEVLKDRNPKV